MAERAGSAADVLDSFRSVRADLDVSVDGGHALVPDLLAMTCLPVLGVDGAGLSVIDAIRVPLGASDDEAALIERLQVTHGEGPCLDAAASGRPVRARLDQIARRWPMFHAEVLQHTRFRSVASVPVRLSPDVLGALDLHYVDPEGAARLRLRDAAIVAREVGRVLRSADAEADDAGEATAPTWLRSARARRRQSVWVAVGILSQTRSINSADALAVLRAHAFAGASTLDDLSNDLVRGRLDPAAI